MQLLTIDSGIAHQIVKTPLLLRSFCFVVLDRCILEFRCVLGYFLCSARYSLGEEPTISEKFLLKLDIERKPHS